MLMLVGEWTRTGKGVLVRGPEDLGDELATRFGDLPQEILIALPIGANQRVLECTLVAVGCVNRAGATARDVFRRPIGMGAKAVVIAHNHPSGNTCPTEADIRLTVHMIKAGRLLGIQLLDHIILAERSWRSLRESTRMWTCD